MDLQKVKGYRNLLRDYLYFYRNTQLHNEIKKQCQWLQHQNTEYIRILLAKQVKDIYNENYRTLQKDIKVELNSGEFYYVHELENTISIQ